MTTYDKLSGNVLYHFDAQVSHLRSLGLKGSDAEFKEALKLIEFHRFVDYAAELFDESSGKFYADMTVEDVMCAHEFDRELRMRIFAAIQLIEVWLRKQVIELNTVVASDELAKNSVLGVSVSQIYCDSNNPTISNRQMHRRDLGHLSSEFERKFSTEEARKYTDPFAAKCTPPAELAFERMTFKSLEKWLKNTKTVYRKRIANAVELPEPIFTSYLGALVDLRNDVAHHAKCWVRASRAIKRFQSNKIPPILESSVRGVPTDSTAYILCLTLYVARRLDSQDPSLKGLSEFLKHSNPDYLNDMYFEENFADTPLWSF